MKKYYFSIICIFCVFMCSFAQAATIDGFKNVTEKSKKILLVKNGTIIEYTNSDAKLTVDNSQIAVAEGAKIKIMDSGRFNVTVAKADGSNATSYQFFSWNAYLKAGKFWTYKDAGKQTKASVLYSRTYLDVSEAKAQIFKVDDYVFASGMYGGELKGKYMTSYYDKTKNISTSSYYEYAMKSDLKVTEPEDKKEEHTHKYTKFVKVLTEATCENSGTSTYKCENCDATQNVEVKKLEHEYIFKMKDGKKHDKVCKNCNKVVSSENHVLNNGKCSQCGFMQTVHKHKYEKLVEVKQEATCNQKGIKIYQCENCDLTKTVEEKKLAHVYVLKMKNDKKHEKICERCGNVSSTSSHTLNKEGACTKCEYAKSPHEHKFEKLIKEKQKATCTQKGIKVYKCTECDKTNEVEEKMLSHVFMLKSKNENKHQKVCTLCKKVESEANHQFNDAKICECGYTKIKQNTPEYWKALQSHLKALGHYKDSVDGVFGKNTRNAINTVLEKGKFGRTLKSNAKWKDVDEEMYNFIMAQPIPPKPLRITKTAEQTGNWDQTWIYHDNKNSDIKVKAVIIYLHGRDNNGTYGHPLVYDELNMPKDVVLVCPILRNGWDNFFDKSSGATPQARGTTKIELLMDQVLKAYPEAVIILEGHSMSTKFLGYMIESNNPRIDGYAFYSPNWNTKPANNIKNCFVSRAYDEDDYERKYMSAFYTNPANNNVKHTAPKAVAKTHGAAPKIMTTDVHWNWVRNVIENKAK